MADRMRWVVVFRLTPRGGSCSYVVQATDRDDAIKQASAKLADRLPYGIGWYLISADEEPLR